MNKKAPKKLNYRKRFCEYLDGKVKFKIYQKVGIAFLIAVIAGCVGWLYEFVFTFINEGTGEWYMQGGNFLPWMNIYAIGAEFNSEEFEFAQGDGFLPVDWMGIPIKTNATSAFFVVIFFLACRH